MSDFPTSRPGTPKHLPVLDGVRGIAILMVMISHLVDGGSSRFLVVRAVTGFTHGGWAGVDLFFVLSGFLITGILLETRGDPHYFRNFYARRTLRIFPLYYGALVVIFLILPRIVSFNTSGLRSLQHDQAWLWLYGTNILLAWKGSWSAFNQDWIWLNHFWSLAVEEHFYLVWPAVVLLLGGRRSLFAGFCVGCVVAVFVGRLAAARLGVNDVALYTLTPFRADALILGALAAILTRGPGGVSRLISPAWGFLAISGMSLLVLRWVGRGDNPKAGQSKYCTALDVFFTAGLVLSVAADPKAAGAQGIIGRLLAHPVLRFFGKYSYGLYVIESILQPCYEQVFSTKILDAKLGSYLLAVLTHLLLCLSATLMLAVLSFHLYEKPFLRLKRFFEGGQPASDKTTVVTVGLEDSALQTVHTLGVAGEPAKISAVEIKR